LQEQVRRTAVQDDFRAPMRGVQAGQMRIG
jgi:hypothetical protein